VTLRTTLAAAATQAPGPGATPDPVPVVAAPDLVPVVAAGLAGSVVAAGPSR